MMEQSKKIYFSKIIYVQIHGWGRKKTYIQLDMIQNEFSVQVYKLSLDPRAAYNMQRTVYFDKTHKTDLISHAVKISHGKNGFVPTLIPKECDEVCIFTYGTKVKDSILDELKPFCDALKFQPYINKKVDNEWLAYRDEYTMHFYGFTDSYIPYMHFDMTYVHSKWPTEKLWDELCNHLIRTNKKLKNIVIC